MNDYGIVIGFLARIAVKLKFIYDNSYTAELIRRIASAFNALFEQSVIIKGFLNEGRLVDAWENSTFYRALSWLLTAPIRAIGFLWSKVKVYVEDSLFYKLVSNSLFGKIIIYAIDKFEILLGGSILVTAAINHTYWKNYYSLIFAFALLVLFYFRAYRNKYKSFGIKYLDFTFFAFVFVIAFVQITGIFPKDSLKFFIFYVTCFLYVLLIVASMRTSKSLNNMVEIALMGISLTGLYGIYQAIRGVPTDPSLVDMTLNAGMPGRVYSTMQNPNSYAEVLILMLPFFVAVIFNAKTIRRKLFFTCAAMPVIVALLATGSRSAWVALILAGFVYVFFKEKRLIPVFILLGLLCIPIIQIVAPSIFLRAMTIFNGNDTSSLWRTQIYETFKPMLKDYWFTGIGLGAGDMNQTFEKMIQNYSLEPVDPGKLTGYIPPHTHNLFFQVWIEAGIFGIASFIWMIWRLFRQSVIAIRNKCDEKAVNLIIAGISGLAGCLVIGTKEYVWFYPRTMVFFFVNIGIIYAAISITKKKKDTFPEN